MVSTLFYCYLMVSICMEIEVKNYLKGNQVMKENVNLCPKTGTNTLL